MHFFCFLSVFFACKLQNQINGLTRLAVEGVVVVNVVVVTVERLGLFEKS